MELTPEEQAAGFIKETIKTGYGSPITGEDEHEEIVIKKLRDDLRIEKFAPIEPDGSGYSQLRKGGYALQRLKRGKDPAQRNSWGPVRDGTVDTLEEALDLSE